MKRTWQRAEYSTTFVTDDDEGWIALELHRRTDDTSELAARIVYWDAEGQFFLTMSVNELPLVIIEDLIAEARSTIKAAV